MYKRQDYRLNVSKPLSQRSKLLFSGQANIHRFINESDFNRIGFAGSLSYLKQFDEFDASIGVQTRPLWLAIDDYSSQTTTNNNNHDPTKKIDFYRNQTSINGKLKKQLNKQWKMSTTLSRGKTQNNVNADLDTDDTALTVSSSYDIDNFRHSISMSYAQEMTGNHISDHISRKSTAISYNNIWLINTQWLASGTLIWQHKKYQGLHPFYFTKQVDNMWLFSGMVQYLHSKSLSYRFNVTAQDKNSNLSLFSYQRFDIGLTAIINF